MTKNTVFLPYYVYTYPFKGKSIKKTDITVVILLAVPTFSVISKKYIFLPIFFLISSFFFPFLFKNDRIYKWFWLTILFLPFSSPFLPFSSHLSSFFFLTIFLKRLDFFEVTIEKKLLMLIFILIKMILNFEIFNRWIEIFFCKQ